MTGNDATDERTDRSEIDASTLSRRGILGGLAGVAAGSTFTGVVSGQDTGWTRVARLSAADGRADDGFGTAVAVAGSRALVGAPAAGNGAGAAYVFESDGTCWHVRQELTDGKDGAAFGTSVALAGDGTVALIGAPDAGSDNRGAVSVFRLDGNAWTETARLTPSARTPQSFGTDVALAADQRTALVGAPVDGRETDAGGSAFVFTYDGEDWAGGHRLRPERLHGSFGSAVALNAAGETAVVGVPWDDEFGLNAGTAWAFERTDGWQLVQEIRDNHGDSNQYGSDVALDAVGENAIVGAPVPYPSAILPAGYASHFVRDTDGWHVTTQLRVSDGTPSDNLGESVAIDASGNTVLAGDPSDDRNGTENVGSTTVFRWTPSGWIEATTFTVDGIEDELFGTAVALDAAGTTAVVGAPSARNNGVRAGAAYVFTGPADESDESPGGGDTSDSEDGGDGTDDTADDTDTGPRTLMIAANEGGVEYRLTVDGDIEPQTPMGDFSCEGNEEITESGGLKSASGLTGPAPDIAGQRAFLGDRYLFTGSVESLELDRNSDDTDVNVYLDEADVSPDRVRGFSDDSGSRHTLMIAANGDGVNYEVAVDGTLDTQSPAGDFSAEDDEVTENDDGTVTAEDVTGPAPDIADAVTYLGDRFLVTGEVVELSLEPNTDDTDVNVYLDEELVSREDVLSE